MKTSKLSQLSDQDYTIASRILAEQRRRRHEAVMRAMESDDDKSAPDANSDSGSTEGASESAPVQTAVLGAYQHRLYKTDDMQRALKNASVPDTRAALNDLSVMGGVRPLAPVPDDFEDRCQELADEFPNIAHVIDEKILPELAISHFGGRGLKLPTLCIQGSPGVGKTYFASQIAKLFQLPFSRVNLEGAQGNFAITGLDKSYGTHNPGQIVRFLARRENQSFVNGIIAFEELDKTAGDHRYSTENALLQILEETTAKSFTDLSIPELRLDITSLNFVFTANTLSTVSTPILSRIQAVELPQLSSMQAAKIAAVQFSKMVKELNLCAAGLVLDNASLNVLGTISPREQKAILRSSIGKAILNRQRDVVIPPEMAQKATRSTIGFF